MPDSALDDTYPYVYGCKFHLFRRTQHRFVYNRVAPKHVCYVFWIESQAIARQVNTKVKVKVKVKLTLERPQRPTGK